MSGEHAPCGPPAPVPVPPPRRFSVASCSETELAPTNNYQQRTGDWDPRLTIADSRADSASPGDPTGRPWRVRHEHDGHRLRRDGHPGRCGGDVPRARAAGRGSDHSGSSRASAVPDRGPRVDTRARGSHRRRAARASLRAGARVRHAADARVRRIEARGPPRRVQERGARRGPEEPAGAACGRASV